MKAYERRRLGKEAFFKLQRWDATRSCWVPFNRQFESEPEARAAAKKPGRYRISRVEETRTDLEPFEV